MMTVKKYLLMLKSFLKLITVEPTMTLYMMAFMTTTIIEQAFFVHKACRVNHNFNKSICDKISAEENVEFNVKVQITVSEFHQWNDIAGHTGPIILALFMGAWSDKRGRKLPLLMGLIGKLYYSSMIVVNAMHDSWPVEYITYTATLPTSLTGADVAIFAAAFAYLSDVTVPESRTLRVTILEVCYLATMPTGIALGSYLFNNVVNHSYAIMFMINASLLVISILYTCIRLKWRTTPEQCPLRSAPNIVTDFFDFQHVMQTIKTVFKKRSGKQRVFFLLLLLAMANYTFQRSEGQQSYLYLQLRLHWNEPQISQFNAIQTAIQVIVLLTGIPLTSTLLKWRDTIIAIIGAIAHSIARIFYIFANSSLFIYIGGVFAALGPIVAPIIRSVVSKLVAPSERGKAFSVLSITDNAIPIVSATIYNQVYKSTIHIFPATIFFVTIGSQLVVLAIFLSVHLTSTNESLMYCEEELLPDKPGTRKESDKGTGNNNQIVD